MTRRVVVAMDRSFRNSIEVFSIVATRIESQNEIVKYSDFFKHMRKLGRRKQIYIPKMLRIIEKLIDENIIVGLKVFTKLDNLLELVENRKTMIIACIVDNNMYRYYTAEGVRACETLRGIPLLVLEDQLKKPTIELIERTHKLGLTMVSLRTIMVVADNIANYSRERLEKALEDIPRIWKL